MPVHAPASQQRPMASASLSYHSGGPGQATLPPNLQAIGPGLAQALAQIPQVSFAL